MEEMSDGAEMERERDHAVLRFRFRCGGGGGVAKKGENGLAGWRAEAAATTAVVSAAAPALSPNKLLNQGEKLSRLTHQHIASKEEDYMV